MEHFKMKINCKLCRKSIIRKQRAQKYCKKCKIIAILKNIANNRKQNTEYMAKWRKNNPTKIKKSTKKYYAKNKEKCCIASRKYYKKHAAEISEQRKLSISINKYSNLKDD